MIKSQFLVFACALLICYASSQESTTSGWDAFVSGVKEIGDKFKNFFENVGKQFQEFSANFANNTNIQEISVKFQENAKQWQEFAGNSTFIQAVQNNTQIFLAGVKQNFTPEKFEELQKNLTAIINEIKEKNTPKNP